MNARSTRRADALPPARSHELASAELAVTFLEGVVRFETTLWNRVDRHLTAAGMPGLGTVMALRMLQRYRSEGRVQDLSRALSITIGAASKLVDRLERDGLATRRPHPDDRRSSLIMLTAAGEQTAQDATTVIEHVVRDTFPDPAATSEAIEVFAGLQLALDQSESTTKEISA
ncbi:MarR family winged helix-turn-helix transcriptional regulator [Agromyces sp. Marseille-Q5079]|uniref:MarR family winged helix-turn-helix transcriptional regulator n=1 Tax=Agromyces sp. Marseille-Q5079 TaxID=3439059 RepID=UPI003D9C86B1